MAKQHLLGHNSISLLYYITMSLISAKIAEPVIKVTNSNIIKYYEKNNMQ